MTFPTRRGRILPPDLDDRRWQDLVDEMRKQLIPIYAPQWTDHNESDLGITLIELFAWLVEQTIYRLNRVPDKNYVAFLNLLGITRYPATPAATYVTFTATANNDTVAVGTQLQTAASETQTPVIFETSEQLTVLPTELKRAMQIPLSGGAAVDLTGTIIGPPAVKYFAELEPQKAIMLTLGFTEPTDREITLNLQLSPPVRENIKVEWRYSRAGAAPDAWPPIIPRSDGSEALSRSGKVQLTVPNDWARQNLLAPAETADTDPLWIGLRIQNTAASAKVTVGFDRIAFNSALAHNALTVRTPQLIGTSNGEPFQVFELPNAPLFKAPNTDTPYSHLQLTVTQDGDQPTPWNLVEDLPSGAGAVYRLNPVSGEILFGNFTAASEEGKQGHGSIPPSGSRIHAVYRYVAGGVSGNIGHSQLISPVTPLSGFDITNLGPGVGGSDEEPIEETLRRAPDVLKTRDRAVTADDYENLAREAATDVAIVGCLAPQGRFADDTGANPKWRKDDPWRFGGLIRAPGTVWVIVVPDQGSDVARPEPPQGLLDEVFRHLSHRCDLGVALKVVGPRYLPVIVNAEIEVFPDAKEAGASEGVIEEDVRNRVMKYLHPTRGGRDGNGWQIGQSVFVSDLFQAVKPADDTAYVTSLSVSPGVPLYHLPPIGSGTEDNFNFTDLTKRPFPAAQQGRASVRIADYELVCAAAKDKHQIRVTPAPMT